MVFASCALVILSESAASVCSSLMLASKRAARHGGSPYPYSYARRDAVETLRRAGWHRWAERVVSCDDFGLDVLANGLALCATRDTKPPGLRDRAKDAMVAVMVLDALVKSHPSREESPG